MICGEGGKQGEHPSLDISWVIPLHSKGYVLIIAPN